MVAAPAVASASPQFRINGTLAGEAKHDVVAVGSLTMENKFVGDWKCRILAGLAIANETEKRVNSVETWEPFDCSGSECRAPIYFTAEFPPEYGPEPSREREKPEEPLYRGRFSASAAGGPLLPWPTELITDGAGKTALSLRKMNLFLDCPSETLIARFNGLLEPLIVNGIGNGLSPSHLVFEGKGGVTNNLNGTWLGGTETEETQLFISGELTILGTSQELITAE